MLNVGLFAGLDKGIYPTSGDCRSQSPPPDCQVAFAILLAGVFERAGQGSGGWGAQAAASVDKLSEESVKAMASDSGSPYILFYVRRD